MYMYEKKSTKGKATAVILMTMILILISGFFIANSTLFNNKPVLPVNQPDAVASLHIPVVLPADETVAAPFAINAKEVLHFFDKTKSEDVLSQAVTEFEGVYRPNQGLDYAYDGKVFEATAMLGGTVTEVKEDAMFGKSVTVKTGKDLEITYQSLSQVSVKKDQVVNQNDVLGLAGENIYNAGRHGDGSQRRRDVRQERHGENRERSGNYLSELIPGIGKKRSGCQSE